MDPIKSGNVIKDARMNLKITQKELASKLFVSDKAVSKWERGLCFPDISILIPLSEELNINLYEILGGEVLNEDKKDEILKETIEFSSREISKTKIKFQKTTTILTSIVIILSLLYYIGFIQEHSVKYNSHLIIVQEPVDSGLDIHINLSNYKNGNAVLVKTSVNNYDIYLNVTQTISTMIFADNDTSDNFIRIGNNICYDFQSGSVRFSVSEDSIINNIYYIDLDVRNSTENEIVQSETKTLVWEQKY